MYFIRSQYRSRSSKSNLLNHLLAEAERLSQYRSRSSKSNPITIVLLVSDMIKSQYRSRSSKSNPIK